MGLENNILEARNTVSNDDELSRRKIQVKG